MANKLRLIFPLRIIESLAKMTSAYLYVATFLSLSEIVLKTFTNNTPDIYMLKSMMARKPS